MSSRPAVAVQHRVAAGPRPPPARSKPPALPPANAALGSSRIPPALTVDLTDDGDNGSGSILLSMSAMVASPVQRDAAARWPNPRTVSNEPAAVRPSGAGVPFPPRPGQNEPEQFTQAASTPVVSVADAMRSDGKKQNFDPPAVARRYPHGSESLIVACTTTYTDPHVPESADYFPWQGNHLEDQLSEQSVKSGFQNKPLIANETNTARPSLWNHLKNKQGLTTLSQLLVTVLDKRQTSGRLTAPSTFKPPPRIVFTATRREQWLQELANSDVVLRRFSKTIPHGIVGKGLLDACLTNNIPLARAVWLAKCVGSNELRSLKRKGTNGAAPIGNEHKWIREWTINVEQWIDGLLGQCGEASWSTRIQYAIRLAATLYNEQLLDHKHYLNWILSSFEASSSERLPFWLLLAQTFWKYLVSSRKLGKKLAECVFLHLKAASQEGSAEILKPLLQRLQQLATTLAIAHRGCMLLPAIWAEYQPLLHAIPQTTNLALRSAIDNLAARNDRLNRRAVI